MPTTFNTTDPKPGYVYDQAVDTWFPLLGIAPGSSVVRWRKTAAGAETSVSGLDDLGATLSYNAGTEQVYLNGVLLVRTEDYLATTGTSVTGLTALAASDVIEVISFNATNVQITDALLETDINAKGDLIVGAAVDTAAILASGTNGQVLSVNTATATGLEWVTSDDANAIQNAIVDAKGDIIAATAADTVARLAVGTNGQVLTAASGEATGLEWATPSSGGMTLLSTTNLSGTTTTISSISGSYVNLFFQIQSATTSATAKITVTLNGAAMDCISMNSTNLIAAVNNTWGSNAVGATTGHAVAGYITNYAVSGSGATSLLMHGGANSVGMTTAFLSVGLFTGAAPITSIGITTTAGTATFSAGSVLLYGVK